MTKYKISYHIKNREGKILQKDSCFYPSINHKELVGYDFLSLVNCYDQIEDEETYDEDNLITNSWYEIESIEEVSC